jgi:SAM-dependent methyltransferase
MLGRMASDRSLRETFDTAAARYHAARPDYPEALFDDLVAETGIQPPARLLEVGCGTGKATVPLARRGFRIDAVELGPALAAEAAHNVAPYGQVEVHTANFETWQPSSRAGFDLAYSATAWHWIDPAIKYDKASALLAPGGHLAIWGAGHAFPAGYDPFFAEIQDVYDEIGEGHPGGWRATPPEEVPDLSAELEESGRFESVAVRRYVWALRYDADSYLALLDTFSGHIAMAPDKRDRLYSEIRRRLAERSDGKLTRHWAAVLTIGRRAG